MSKIYFLSFPAFRSLRKVLSSSQKRCHFSSTCATSYAARLATRLLRVATGARSARAPRAATHSISARIDDRRAPLCLAARRLALPAICVSSSLEQHSLQITHAVLLLLQTLRPQQVSDATGALHRRGLRLLLLLVSYRPLAVSVSASLERATRATPARDFPFKGSKKDSLRKTAGESRYARAYSPGYHDGVVFKRQRDQKSTHNLVRTG